VEEVIIRIALALLFLTSCTPSPNGQLEKTLQVSAARMAEIRSNPHVKLSRKGGDSWARLSGLESDSWPAGIMFGGSLMDPYLEELGFSTSTMITAINGKKVHDVFLSRWKKHGRLGGFYPANYEDLVDYLFVENKWDEFVVTVYVDLPSDASHAQAYVPKIENWLVKLN
jgi:hypothetical protein